jgi:hypothetical protein
MNTIRSSVVRNTIIFVVALVGSIVGWYLA